MSVHPSDAALEGGTAIVHPFGAAFDACTMTVHPSEATSEGCMAFVHSDQAMREGVTVIVQAARAVFLRRNTRKKGERRDRIRPQAVSPLAFLPRAPSIHSPHPLPPFMPPGFRKLLQYTDARRRPAEGTEQIPRPGRGIARAGSLLRDPVHLRARDRAAFWVQVGRPVVPPCLTPQVRDMAADVARPLGRIVGAY